MTPEELKIECEFYEKTLLDKGYMRVKVYFTVNWLYEDGVVACVSYSTGEYTAQKNEYISSKIEDGWSASLSKVANFIDNLKSVKDTKRDDFIAAVGRLIDQGRDVGIEVDFLNPLTQMMEKLSSNIITKQPSNIIDKQLPF